MVIKHLRLRYLFAGPRNISAYDSVGKEFAVKIQLLYDSNWWLNIPTGAVAHGELFTGAILKMNIG